MQINITDQASRKRTRKQHPLQERFARLNSQIARQRRLNARFKTDLDELMARVTQYRRDADRSQLENLTQLASKLVAFAGRKSLSDWHRDEIVRWLQELLFVRIAPLDQATAERLHTCYQENIAALSGLTREQMLEQLDAARRWAEEGEH